ncbi:N-acyl-aromatic-L-amino acid amidohydrolase (carboxylate-forming), partial [Eschrichtius robustus]|nr:N-acyl-aromatic-L-amino acid amidohydrolase (carboxylate-forming) [Eschrichtius robustus]
MDHGSSKQQCEALHHVAVTRATHGNETASAYLARHWLRVPGEVQRLSFSTVPVLLASPVASAACCRYVGHDLSHAFTGSFLRANPDDPHELSRARYLNHLLGPKASGRPSTYPRPSQHHGLTWKAPTTFMPCMEMEAYGTVSSVDFPRTEAGDLAGTVHPQLRVYFEPLRPGAPIFQIFSGEDVLCEGESAMDPVFINEVAYYEEGIAFLQTEKLTFSVPALPSLASTPPGSLIQATPARPQPALLNSGS